MLGVILLYVGAVLLINGIGGLGKIDLRSMAVMNFMVGGLALVASLIQLVRAESTGDFFGVATSFLFTFTYQFSVSINNPGIQQVKMPTAIVAPGNHLPKSFSGTFAR